MARSLAFFLSFFSLIVGVAGQGSSVLHIKVALARDGKMVPVPRHALLISDNPSTVAPRRVVTGIDGTAMVRLPPGNYTVESDQPIAFEGKAYQWTETLDIVAGRDTVLELTTVNAEITAAGSASSSETDPWLLLSPWRDSVVQLWTPTTHASGFVIDSKGLIATSQRVLGTAASVEVEISPAIKVAATILAADRARDVAVLWIDANAIQSVKPLALECASPTQTAVVDGQKVFAIEAPLLQQKGTTSGTAGRVNAHSFTADLALASGGTGGPVFSSGGQVIGITSAEDERAAQRANSRVVRLADVCEVVATAAAKMQETKPPAATRLPVESDRPFPIEALQNAAQSRSGSLIPYQASSSDFDIAFITPTLTYAAQHQSQQTNQGGRAAVRRTTDLPPAVERVLTQFNNWAQYVSDFPPVVLIRVTPKLVEGFWTKVARGAAQAQGVAIPPIRRVKTGFSHLRAFCGDTEVLPIHPFKLEERVTENDAIYEGLYVFDPDALAPSCGTVKLMLYSDKEPEKGDTVVVDPKILQQIWQDFGPYRQ